MSVNQKDLLKSRSFLSYNLNCGAVFSACRENAMGLTKGRRLMRTNTISPSTRAAYCVLWARGALPLGTKMEIGPSSGRWPACSSLASRANRFSRVGFMADAPLIGDSVYNSCRARAFPAGRRQNPSSPAERTFFL